MGASKKKSKQAGELDNRTKQAKRTHVNENGYMNLASRREGGLWSQRIESQNGRTS